MPTLPTEDLRERIEQEAENRLSIEKADIWKDVIEEFDEELTERYNELLQARRQEIADEVVSELLEK
jgi:hypothetical protein